MYLQKVISRKTIFLNKFFVGVLKVNDENSRIRIRIPQLETWIPESGSTPKYHGSGTLFVTPYFQGVAGLCRDTTVLDGGVQYRVPSTRLQCMSSITDLPGTYQLIHCYPQHNIPSSPSNIPHPSKPYSDNIGDFLRRLAFRIGLYLPLWFQELKGIVDP